MGPRSQKLPVRLEGFGDIVVHMLDWGNVDARDTVVCVHGLTRNAHDFDRLAAALAAEGKRVIALDMPGRGDSPWLANPLLYGYPLYVSACIAVMDNFHLRGVEWVGTSMGGIIGMMIAAGQSGRIKRMVLNDIGAQISKEGLERIIAYVSTLPTRFADEAEATGYMKQAFAPFGITEEAVWEEFIRNSLTEHPEGGLRPKTDPAIAEPLRVETKDYTEIDAVDLSGLWEMVKCPTLILRGEHSDLLTPETMKAMLAANFKAKGETIKGAGHAPSLTTPEQIRLVTRFLGGHTAMHVSAIGA